MKKISILMTLLIAVAIGNYSAAIEKQNHQFIIDQELIYRAWHCMGIVVDGEPMDAPPLTLTLNKDKTYTSVAGSTKEQSGEWEWIEDDGIKLNEGKGASEFKIVELSKKTLRLKMIDGAGDKVTMVFSSKK